MPIITYVDHSRFLRLNVVIDQITISQFKATCLRLLAEVNRSKRPITITKNGVPLVVVYPANNQSKRAKFGFASETVSFVGDLIEPIASPESWDTDS